MKYIRPGIYREGVCINPGTDDLCPINPRRLGPDDIGIDADIDPIAVVTPEWMWISIPTPLFVSPTFSELAAADIARGRGMDLENELIKALGAEIELEIDKMMLGSISA